MQTGEARTSSFRENTHDTCCCIEGPRIYVTCTTEFKGAIRSFGEEILTPEFEYFEY